MAKYYTKFKKYKSKYPKYMKSKSAKFYSNKSRKNGTDVANFTSIAVLDGSAMDWNDDVPL